MTQARAWQTLDAPVSGNSTFPSITSILDGFSQNAAIWGQSTHF
jgi:hypothetical protein